MRRVQRCTSCNHPLPPANQWRWMRCADCRKDAWRGRHVNGPTPSDEVDYADAIEDDYSEESRP